MLSTTIDFSLTFHLIDPVSVVSPSIYIFCSNAFSLYQLHSLSLPHALFPSLSQFFPQYTSLPPSISGWDISGGTVHLQSSENTCSRELWGLSISLNYSFALWSISLLFLFLSLPPSLSLSLFIVLSLYLSLAHRLSLPQCVYVFDILFLYFKIPCSLAFALSLSIWVFWFSKDTSFSMLSFSLSFSNLSLSPMLSHVCPKIDDSFRLVQGPV